jgi:hypothetical protein
MSSNAMEKALWQASTNPADARRFRDDAQAYLKDFRLDEKECAMMLSWDVVAIASRGVNPLLLMQAFATVNGMGRMLEYIMRMNQPSGAAPAE